MLITVILFAAVDVKAQCNEQLVNNCMLEIGDAKYMKEFRVKLKRARKGQPPPTARFTVTLNKGGHYRFNILNAIDYEGKVILQLYDRERLLISSLNLTDGKMYSQIDFMCTKTAIYQIFMSFKDGKEGCAVGILSLVNK